MDGLNKVFIIGNLGADPELRMLPGGNAVLKLRVATSEGWYDKDKERQERTEWHRVTVFGKSAEYFAGFLRKGMSVSIEGRNQTSSYEKDGQKHYSTEVIAVRVWAPKTSSTSTSATASAGASASADAPFAPATLNGGYGRATPAATTATEIPF